MALLQTLSSPLVFTVHRREPELVTPSEPTPHELKTLSDIDDRDGLRNHIAGISFFRGSPSTVGRDPVRIVREALAKTLNFYYPFAGRLREGPNRKLMVDCTGEGVLFVEADADIRLDQFGSELQPPFPCLEELVYGAHPPGDFLTSPLLSIQVTRLKCGGFILGSWSNHVLADGVGMMQFFKTMAEMAKGADSPSMPPVWARELLLAREPPVVTHAHPEFDNLPNKTAPTGRLIVKSFFFGHKELTSLRQQLPPNLRARSSFEVLTACVWRCRTIALGIKTEEEVQVRFALNARHTCNVPPLPDGFYGNAIVSIVARAEAGELLCNPLSYAVELVRAEKARVTEGYLHSVANLMVLRGKPSYKAVWTYQVSDTTNMRSSTEEVDFGWGVPVYSGPALGGRVPAWDGTFYISYRNHKGELGILVPVSLPALAMERFQMEIESITKDLPSHL